MSGPDFRNEGLSTRRLPRRENPLHFLVAYSLPPLPVMKTKQTFPDVFSSGEKGSAVSLEPLSDVGVRAPELGEKVVVRSSQAPELGVRGHLAQPLPLNSFGWSLCLTKH